MLIHNYLFRVLILLSLVILTSCDLFSEKVIINLAGKNVTLEIAITEEVRAKGLSNRPYLGEDKGMIFIFPKPDQVCFWMKDTYVALDAIFINRGGRIVQIDQMQPTSTKRHCSRTAVRYVIELNQGWSRLNGLGRGMELDPLDIIKLEEIIVKHQNLE